MSRRFRQCKLELLAANSLYHGLCALYDQCAPDSRDELERKIDDAAFAYVTAESRFMVETRGLPPAVAVKLMQPLQQWDWND